MSWEVAPNIATVVSIGAVVYQLWQSRRHARTAFEDNLAREYRDIISKLPVAALLGEKLTPEQDTDSLPYFYRYIDLCNEQVFLRKKGRISRDTWSNWCSGIRGNLGRSAFTRAWRQIRKRSDRDDDCSNVDFDELRWLESHEFRRDPHWLSRWCSYVLRWCSPVLRRVKPRNQQCGLKLREGADDPEQRDAA